MHRSAVALLAVALIVLSPVHAMAYSSSQSTSGTENGASRTFTFSSLPPSAGNVTVAVFLRGDFNSSAEYAAVSVNGSFLGNATGTAPYNSNSNCLQGTTTYTVPASAVSSGSMSVNVNASSRVDYGPCEPWTYTVSVSYTNNTAPSISNIGNQTINEDTSGSVAVTVSDAQTSAGSLGVSAISSNTAVVANSGLTWSGSGSNRTLTMSPVANASGATTISMTVTDAGGLTATDNFQLTVNPVNDPPVADAGGPYAGAEGSAIGMNGSGSSDIDSTISSYTWDCDNNGSYETTSGSATGAACSFVDNGTYTVRLQVVDSSGGASAADSATVTVSNVAPTASASGDTAGLEGSVASWSVIGLDPSSVDQSALAIGWVVTNAAGATVATGTGSGMSFTPDDDGTYTATATVTDPQGASASDSVTLVASNVAPTATAAGDTTALEGGAATWTVVGLDASSVDQNALGIAWVVTNAVGTNVASGTGTSMSFTPDDDGTYTATATVTDPQGASASDSVTLVVSNVAPTATASGPTTGTEGTLATFTATGSDPSGVDQAALTFAWTLTNAAGTSVATSGSPSLSWSPADDGTYVATVTTTDPQGATGTDTVTIVVANAAPEITSFTGPATGDEGQLLSFVATVDDVGTGDLADLVLTWDWGDGSAAETGLALDHTFADDGSYTITVTLDDQDAGTDTETLAVTVANVAPVIDSTPPSAALEGVLYTYQPTVVDPGDEVIVWSISASAPASMTIDAATGLLSYTPDYADALVGTFGIVLTVDDGDGGIDLQSWTIDVSPADADADGLPDGWELANGLDPTDPNDASADPDADGLTNADELAEGQDPNSFDGPTAPSLAEPLAGDEVATDSPDLVWDDASDPQIDPLTYSVEVYSDAALSTLVASASGLADGSTGQQTWKVDVLLTEDAMFWWRANANDGWVDGPWSATETFVVNAVNEEPGVPALTAPIGGEFAATDTPLLQWTEVSDIDGDAVTYDVAVYDLDGGFVADATGVVGDGLAAEWTVDVALAEDNVYTWTARGVDEHGLAGAWAEAESFFVSTANAAPSAPVFLSPVEGDWVYTNTPGLNCSESTDPEGASIEYVFEVDSDASFDSPDYAVASRPSPSWDLGADGVELAEDAITYARVRAIDGDGVSSTADTVSFFVSANNDAPEVPVLSAPAEGDEVAASPTLVVVDPLDPEGGVVYVEFAVARDGELSDVITGVEGVVVTGAGTTSWTVPVRLEGTVWWTARAVDADGEASDWAAPWSFAAPAGEAEPPPPGDDDDDDDGCDCESSVASGSASLAWLLLAPVLALRRRR